jgi:hypothetical protein
VVGVVTFSGLTPPAHAGPTYSIFLDVPGGLGPEVNQSGPAPFQQAVSGTDGQFASGFAFGRAQLGNLGAKATALNTRPPFVGGAAGSSVSVQFEDIFPVNFPGTGFGVLKLTVTLDGTTTFTGDNKNGSHVGLSFVGESNVGPGAVTLTGPGTATLELPVTLGDFADEGIHLRAVLDLDVTAFEPGSVNSDFSETFKIKSVQLFDGTTTRDVTLVDSAGNVLPVATAAVPEPGSLLLAIGMAASLVAAGLRSCRRAARASA